MALEQLRLSAGPAVGGPARRHASSLLSCSPSQHASPMRTFAARQLPTRTSPTRAASVAVDQQPLEQQQVLSAVQTDAPLREQPQHQQQHDEPAAITVQDDLQQLLDVLPPSLNSVLIDHPLRSSLIEVVLDLGRRPEARFQGHPVQLLSDAPVMREDLELAAAAVGPFGSDNRAGIQGTLHRISALRSRKGDVVGLTCRVGRAVSGHASMVRDILEANLSVLFLGRPGVGKTTAIREIARTLADTLGRRVVVIDTSNEIGGDGDVPHPAIGGARRMQVADAARQHDVMIEAVENHMPEVLIVDEIGTAAEALACRTIAERGVALIGTAHGCFLENLIKNPTLSDLVGGVASVTLGDEEARSRGTQKSILERRGPPTFPVVVEMRDRAAWVAHDTADSVDALLVNKIPKVQLRMREGGSAAQQQQQDVTCFEVAYDQVEDQILAQLQAAAAASAGGASASSEAVAAAVAAAAAAAASDSANASNIDELVASLLGGGGDAGSSEEGSFWGSTAALERFRGLSEAEALQELQVLRYISGQAGLLRRRGMGFGGGGAGGGGAAAGGGADKKKKNRTKASARRG